MELCIIHGIQIAKLKMKKSGTNFTPRKLPGISFGQKRSFPNAFYGRNLLNSL
jgi:hypothetical protein